jgi:hypothetical protein
MGSTGHSIHETLLEYSGAREAVQADTFTRNQIRLEFDSGAPVEASLRDLRSTCCMIDIGHSIFTLAFSDVISCLMPEHPGSAPLILRVRVGCLARDANALLARNLRRSNWQRQTWSRQAPTRTAVRPAVPLHAEAAPQETERPGGNGSKPAFDRRNQAAVQDSSGREEQRQSLEDIEKMLSEVW